MGKSLKEQWGGGGGGGGGGGERRGDKNSLQKWASFVSLLTFSAACAFLTPCGAIRTQ